MISFYSKIENNQKIISWSLIQSFIRSNLKSKLNDDGIMHFFLVKSSQFKIKKITKLLYIVQKRK